MDLHPPELFVNERWSSYNVAIMGILWHICVSSIVYVFMPGHHESSLLSHNVVIIGSSPLPWSLMLSHIGQQPTSRHHRHHRDGNNYSLVGNGNMGLLPDTQNCGCACAGNAGNIFTHRPFQRKPLVSDPGMHHGTCVTHVPWCMSGSLTLQPAILRIW